MYDDDDDDADDDDDDDDGDGDGDDEDDGDGDVDDADDDEYAHDYGGGDDDDGGDGDNDDDGYDGDNVDEQAALPTVGEMEPIVRAGNRPNSSLVSLAQRLHGGQVLGLTISLIVIVTQPLSLTCLDRLLRAGLG